MPRGSRELSMIARLQYIIDRPLRVICTVSCGPPMHRHIVLAALALVVCGRGDAQTLAEASTAVNPAVEAPDEPQLPDLADHPFPLLVWSAFEVERDYFDKSRLDPRAQLVSATAAIGRQTPEFFAEVVGDELRVRVRSSNAEFSLADVTTLIGAAIRLEDILGFSQSILDLEPQALHEQEYAAINGLFEPLDPHTVLLTPEQHADLGVRTKGEFGGVGAKIRTEARRILIVSVLPDMPAAKAGIQVGDVVLTIDSESTVNMTPEQAQQKLRGPVGSKVALTILRAGKKLAFDVERATIKIESVRAVRLPDGVAYLGVSAFQEHTAEEARAALTGLGSGVTAVVLDLRGNAGGVLTQANQMVDDWVDRGELVLVRSAQGDEVAEAEPGAVLPTSVPLVVLVDQESASAAEIVSGGLQALGRAVVVGRTTFGKGTVQMVRAAAPYGQELALKLSLAEWLVAGGKPIQGRGVIPDLTLQPVEPSNVPGVVRFYDEERFERARERARAAHLASAAHDPVALPAAIGRRLYYLADGEIPAAVRQGTGGAAREVPDELRDPEIRISFALARDLAGTTDAAARREATVKSAARIGAEEDARITRALAGTVDWSPAPEGSASPSLEVGAKVSNSAPIAAGAPFGLRVTVRNTGNTTAHRVHVITDCVHDELDGIELVLGAIAAGATVERELQLHVMPWHADFTDAIDVAAHVGDPGPKPIASARVMFEVAGANKPALAYAYWIVDDPELVAQAPTRPRGEDGSAPSEFSVVGNGDGVLQPGERVLLGFAADNLGPGSSPDVRALLRNLSGRQGLLEEGFYHLGPITSGGTRKGAFGISVSPTADPSLPIELELVVGDARMRTSVQDRLRFRVLAEQRMITPLRQRVQIGEDGARLYAGAHPSSSVVARADPGTQLDVVGEVGGFDVIDGGEGRRMFLPGDIDGLGPASGKRVQRPLRPRVQVLPPTVAIDSLPRVSTAATVVVRGVARHPERVRDVVVLVRPPGVGQIDHKVYFATNDVAEGDGARAFTFEAAVPLEPGGNRISVVARDAAKVVRREDLWVYRPPD